MPTISTLIITLITIAGAPPINRSEFASSVKSALNRLQTVSFEVDFQAEWRDATRGQTLDTRLRLTVVMSKGGRSRAEAKKDNQPVWIVVCNGHETVEWVAESNEWTQYPIPPKLGNDDGLAVKQLLLPRRKYLYLPSKYGTSWLDCDSATSRALEKAITHEQSRLRKKGAGVGRTRFALEYKDTIVHPDGSLMGSGNETYKVFFDPESYFLVRETTIAGGGPLGIRVFSGQMDFHYENWIANPALAENTFEFTPPPGAIYVSPDDPRFAPPPQLEGKIAPDFLLAAIDGTTSKLDNHIGKRPVLLVFWATWCGPCNQEIPFLRELRSEHAPEALAILAVSSEPKREDIARFARKKKMTYQVLHDAKKEVSKAYQATAIPRTILIDQSGRIVKIWKGWSGEEEAKEIRAEIKKLLK